MFRSAHNFGFRDHANARVPGYEHHLEKTWTHFACHYLCYGAQAPSILARTMPLARTNVRTSGQYSDQLWRFSAPGLPSGIDSCNLGNGLFIAGAIRMKGWRGFATIPFHFEMTKLVGLSTIFLASLPFSVAQLNTLAQAAGKKYFGTATDNPELTNAAYVAQLGNTSDFHQLTAVRYCGCFFLHLSS